MPSRPGSSAQAYLVALSVKEITGRFWRRSQTTDVPLTPVEAKMCSTLPFQATQVMSLNGCVGAPGVYTLGVLGFAKSQIRISLSVAPEASKLGLNELKSRPRTGPLCFCTRATRGSPCICLVTIAGFQNPILPSTMPPASIPRGSVVEPADSPLHASLWKRSLLFTAPLICISLPAPGVKSTAIISRSAVVSNESSMALATVPTAIKLRS